MAGGWVYQDRNVVFITLRVPIDQAALLDAGVWEMIINSSYVGHAAPEHTPDCDTDQEWGCAPVTDFCRRADAAAGGPWWAHVDRAGSFTEPDSPFVAEVNASWDRVLRLGPEAWVEVVAPQLHPEWVVEARPVSTYRRRPAQPAPNVTARPGFATAAHRQLEALRRNSPIYRAPETP